MKKQKIYMHALALPPILTVLLGSTVITAQAEGGTVLPLRLKGDFFWKKVP